MLAEQRRKEIMALLLKNGYVKNGTIQTALGVSGETVRKDLKALESLGVLYRVHGGAVLPREHQSSAPYVPFKRRKMQNISEKEEVARAAASYIHEGDSIALDSGTTALALAHLIRQQFRSLTVVTNSLAILQELSCAPGITVIGTGGVYQAAEHAFYSDLAGLIFAHLHLDTCFLTACGVSADRGVTYQRTDEFIVENQMVRSASKTIVIADSSKLGCASMIKGFGIECVSRIITDSKATPAQIDPFHQLGIPVAKACFSN